jgi:molybdenum cofactor cytidylyltransferase
MKDEDDLKNLHPSPLIPHPSHVAAILLAAGQSRRMGAFKPLLPFGRETVVEACVSYLMEGGAQTVIVVIGHRHEEMRQRLSHLPVRLALNPETGSEMGASIRCGARELPAESKAVLIALVDQPAVPSGVPQTLIDAWKQTGARLVVPEYAGRGGHPVLLDATLRAELMNLDPERGLRAVFDAHRAETLRVPVQSPYVAGDMDTWDDYRALYEAVFGVGPPGAPPG